MKRVFVALIAGTILSGVAAVYAGATLAQTPATETAKR
jgi:hypothetical protein